MPKIDVSKIAGYEEMSAEDKIHALIEYEFEESAPPTSDSEAKLKGALSRANSEAADWKRKYLSTLDDAKRAEEERAEKDKARDEELETLRREQAISKLEAQYLAAGYTAEMASASAKAQVDGDTATVLANQMKFIEDKKKALEAEALGKQPDISHGEPPEGDDGSKKLDEILRRYAGL